MYKTKIPISHSTCVSVSLAWNIGKEEFQCVLQVCSWPSRCDMSVSIPLLCSVCMMSFVFLGSCPTRQGLV